MKLDYIIVGCGLAGIAFCEYLRKNNKSFIVFDDGSQQSSKVAGGLYNPVVLKRFTAAWKAKELLDTAIPYYKELEVYLDVKIIHNLPILRVFNSVEEQNDWFAASDKPILSEFLSPGIQKNQNSEINANFGLGEVLDVGRIDTSLLIDRYINRLKGETKFLGESFDYDVIEITDKTIQYKSIEAKQIVFSDGFGLKKNNFFNDLPLVGSKGEYIVVSAPKLKLDYILKGSVFIIPLGNDSYLVGATYNNQDKTKTPTPEKKQELMLKLEKMINCEFNVFNHFAAIRPTVKDRRPLVGIHANYKNLSVLNGLGTRGVMASPYLAKQLFNYLENDEELDSQIDIQRFENLFVS